MTQSTPGDGMPRPPFDPVRRASGGAAPEPAEAAAARRRRPPWWLVVLGVLLVGGLGVVAVLLASNQGGQIVPEPEVITLAPPSPTIEPITREPGTTFADSLPSTVLQYALSEVVPEQAVLIGGALEGYRAVYTDGGSSQVVLLAGQWVSPESATTAAATWVDAALAETGATQGDAGAVEVDGAEVGRFATVERADGTATLTWTNGTVVLQLDGPAEALADLFTAFPL